MTQDKLAEGRLAGKVAIVTGAQSSRPGLGIGKAVAIAFAREGAQVVLVNRSEQSATDLAQQIQQDGGDCFAFAGDMSQAQAVEDLMTATIERYGRIDILYNNVGSGGPGTAATVSEDIWDRCLTSNLTTTMLCCKHAIPHLRASGGGSIINSSTPAAIQGFRRGETGFAAYSAAKAGVIGYTRSLAADFAADRIRGNCLLVGMVNTPVLEQFGEEARERRRLATPLQTEGTAWDVAWAAVYLASDEAQWITGIALPIDGGQTAIRDFPE